MTDEQPGKPLPTNKNHLERLISTWAQDPEVEATAGRLHRLIAVSVLAEILDGLTSDGEPRLAIKGGAAMELRFGANARSSRDVDATTDIAFDDAFAEIADRLHTGWEGFTGVVGERTEITRIGITPPPQRTNIHLRFKDKPFAKLPFEIGRAEANSFTLIEQTPNAIDMARAQLPAGSEVAVLGVHYQIAQKLHACTEEPEDRANQRVHDLYDIALLADLARAAGLHHTWAACDDTFKHRAMHTWPPALTAWSDWPQIWDGLDLPAAAAMTYEEASASVGALIDDICAAAPTPLPLTPTTGPGT